MNKDSWIDHINAWRSFLLECLSDSTERGDIIRIERQIRTVERVRCAAILNPRLLLSFIHPENIVNNADTESISPILDLNEIQIAAVNKALNDSELSLIQGPPGTGKTQVISEICLQLFKRNPSIRILVCSETHVAVNNVLSRISNLNQDIRIVRIRDKEKNDQANDYSSESIVNTYLEWFQKQKVSSDVKSIIESEFLNCEQNSLEKALALSANIVGATCNMIAAYDFRDSTEMFDVAIVDEVCKATLPEILAPLIVSQKAILIGDPKQLPPVFCSEERNVIKRIEGCNLNRYLYIDELLSANSAITLDVQYRMTNEIANVISQVFYDGLLKNGRNASESDSLRWITYNPTQQWPIDSEDSSKQQIYNEDECRIIKHIVDDYRKTRGAALNVAIISPYRSQVQVLRRMLGEVDGVYIDTVDGFQGKEANVVVFSITRTKGSYRFLADPRRLNVALSRARDQIVFVGEQNYCNNNSLLNIIMRYFVVENYKL